MASGQPNPQRNFIDGRYLPKVFIVYPHKPTVYEQRLPPENAADDPAAWRAFEEEVEEHEMAAEEEIKRHDNAVKRFAEFLHSQSVAVAYDLLVRDTGTTNKIRWAQQQIDDSDYLIIITTPSLGRFLDGKCPTDKEPLFSSDYLYNLIHSNRTRSNGTTLEIVPVFLGIVKNLEYVPVALRGGSVYEVWDREYRVPLTEDLTSLLCRLTKQDRFTLPPTGRPIIIPPRKNRFGPKPSVPHEVQASSVPPPPPGLLQNHTPLDIRTLALISEKSGFAQQWKNMAVHLGVSRAEVARCEARAGGDDSEACLQMLKLSAQERQGGCLTPAFIADAIHKSGCTFLYQTLESVL